MSALTIAGLTISLARCFTLFPSLKGYQSRRVTCVRRRDSQPVDESLCDPQMEPADTEACNVDPCPPVWVEGEWGPCSKHCGEGAEQSREIKCEQVISGGIPTVVDDSQCVKKVGPKGPTSQECNKDVSCPLFHTGPWKPVRLIRFTYLRVSS